MTRLPILDSRTLEKVLFGLGFEKVRQKGSHVLYRHPDGRTTTIPFHKGRAVARPRLHEILREIQLTPEMLLDALKNL
jgi:predicted RNA binding protein YcfA (HicA-like mRNA interferase family)